jgi:transposase InsO family protein
LEGVQEFELRLRREGLIVHWVHSDRGKEFVSDQLQKWCRNRGIYKTTTVSDDPAANGRAENAVGKVKRAIRTLLLASDLPATRWSSAARYVGEMFWQKYKGEVSIGLAFGARVLVRTKNWYLATTFEARAVSGRFFGTRPRDIKGLQHGADGYQ